MLCSCVSTVFLICLISFFLSLPPYPPSLFALIPFPCRLLSSFHPLPFPAVSCLLSTHSRLPLFLFAFSTTFFISPCLFSFSFVSLFSLHLSHSSPYRPSRSVVTPPQKHIFCPPLRPPKGAEARICSDLRGWLGS
jgi:hypothetical protein